MLRFQLSCFRYGRWKVLIPTGILQLVTSLSIAFVDDYYLYVALRFFLAANVSGAYMIGFVLSEFPKRPFVSITGRHARRL